MVYIAPYLEVQPAVHIITYASVEQDTVTIGHIRVLINDPPWILLVQRIIERPVLPGKTGRVGEKVLILIRRYILASWEKIETRQGVGIDTQCRAVVDLLRDIIDIGVHRQFVLQELSRFANGEVVTLELIARFDPAGGSIGIGAIGLCSLVASGQADGIGPVGAGLKEVFQIILFATVNGSSPAVGSTAFRLAIRILEFRFVGELVCKYRGGEIDLRLPGFALFSRNENNAVLRLTAV